MSHVTFDNSELVDSFAKAHTSVFIGESAELGSESRRQEPSLATGS